MRASEIYAFCIAGSVLGLVWLIVGIPGLLCAIAAMIAGNCDVQWIDDLEAKQDATKTSAPADLVDMLPSPDSDLPRRDVAWRAVPIPPPPGVVKKDTSSPLKPRWRKLPANVVVLKARKVS